MTGCVVENADIYRPLQRHKAPNYIEVVSALSKAEPQSLPHDIEKSFKKLRFARFNFGVFTGYQDWANYLSFADIDDSLKLFPKNPFAWSLLSNYLSLEKQPAAAAVAAERSISIVNEIANYNNLLSVDLTALRWTTELNRAIFLNQAGEFEEATRQLKTLDSESIDEPFVKLAIIWARCVALIGSDGSPTALSILQSEAPNFVDPLPESIYFKAYDYPQYFEANKRQAIFLLLEGESQLRLGNFSESEKILRLSISSDPHLWVAQLTLATALYSQGRLSEATEVLAALVRLKPTHSLYSYDLARFNLGTLYLEQGNAASAIHNFEEVVDTSKTRDKRFQNKIFPHLPAEIAAKVKPTSQGRVVSEAYNNLGVSFLNAAANSTETQSTAAREAIDYYGKAQAAAPGVVLTNVARAQWYSGHQHDAISLLTGAVRGGNHDAAAREELLQFGLRSDDSLLTFEALNAYLDTAGSASDDAAISNLQSISQAASLLLSKAQATAINEKVASLLVRR